MVLFFSDTSLKPAEPLTQASSWVPLHGSASLVSARKSLPPPITSDLVASSSASLLYAHKSLPPPLLNESLSSDPFDKIKASEQQAGK